MTYDPLHGMLVHSITSRLSEKGRRWPFKMGAIEVGKKLNDLSNEKLHDMALAATEGDRTYLYEQLKGVGIE